jgi:hypothetical protein
VRASGATCDYDVPEPVRESAEEPEGDEEAELEALGVDAPSFDPGEALSFDPGDAAACSLLSPLPAPVLR